MYMPDCKHTCTSVFHDPHGNNLSMCFAPAKPQHPSSFWMRTIILAFQGLFTLLLFSSLDYLQQWRRKNDTYFLFWVMHSEWVTPQKLSFSNSERTSRLRSSLHRRGCCARPVPAPALAAHPLQCCTLELCFSMALDRLPAVVSAAQGAGLLPGELAPEEGRRRWRAWAAGLPSSHGEELAGWRARAEKCVGWREATLFCVAVRGGRKMRALFASSVGG